jgi:hypothetical protein
MAKYQLVTNCAWAGTEQYHEIDGDFNSPEEALEAFGGHEEAYQQAIEDHSPEYYIEEIGE